MPLRSLIVLASRITVAMNEAASTAESDDTSQQHRGLLPENSRAAMGEALNRILQITRPQEASAACTAQEYRDSVHVGIVHELSLFGTGLWRIIGRAATPGNPAG